MRKNVFERGEFMDFMDTFLKAHPEVVDDQKTGWDIYWNPHEVDLEALYPSEGGGHPGPQQPTDARRTPVPA